MATIKESVSQFLKKVISDILLDQESKNIRASGKSAQSLRFEATPDGGKLFGVDYFKYQERGRGPGGFPPIQSIIDWVNSKGITPESGSIEGMAFAISKKIAKNGTDIFQGKREGLSIKELVAKQRPELRSELIKGTKEEILKKL